MVELAQACSHPAIIFLLRMSCFAAWILWKNHNGHILIVCSFRRLELEGIDYLGRPDRVSGVMRACDEEEIDDEYEIHSRDFTEAFV